MTCTDAFHETLKKSKIWPHLKVVGWLNRPAGVREELRNCWRCDATLGATGFTVLRSGMTKEIEEKLLARHSDLVTIRAIFGHLDSARHKAGRGYSLSTSERRWLDRGTPAFYDAMQARAETLVTYVSRLEHYLQDIKAFPMEDK